MNKAYPTLIFGFDKSRYLPDLEIEKLYEEKIKTMNNPEIQMKLHKASVYDPRKTDIYFSSKWAANKAEKIADKLQLLSPGAFITDSYPYKWVEELSGTSIFKVINKRKLKAVD